MEPCFCKNNNIGQKPVTGSVAKQIVNIKMAFFNKRFPGLYQYDREQLPNDGI